VVVLPSEVYIIIIPVFDFDVGEITQVGVKICNSRSPLSEPICRFLILVYFGSISRRGDYTG